MCSFALNDLFFNQEVLAMFMSQLYVPTMALYCQAGMLGIILDETFCIVW